ncbi:sulfurtransferase [Halothiobacillus diazotrophicus]|nr:rhodanese-like domain-containing protein [Halothiobacillus diazotrophicus]
MNQKPTRMPWGIPLMLLMTTVMGIGQARAAESTVLPGPLVTVQWLHDHAKSVQIVDIRDDLDGLMDNPKYITIKGKKVLQLSGGHIPDALSVNFWALRVKRTVEGKKLDFQFPTAEEFQVVMRTSVLENGKPIVLAPTGDDAISLQEAAFLALELETFGVPADQVAILNGGTHAWLAAGYPVVVDAIVPMDSSKWLAGKERHDLIATTKQVKAAQRSHESILDARPLSEFIGIAKSPVVPELGHIRGARALPAEALYFRAEDGSWRYMNAAHYHAAVRALHLGKVSPAIVYCNTGQYAAGAWFILNRIMGLHHVREYAGSIYTWENKGQPVVGL